MKPLDLDEIIAALPIELKLNMVMLSSILKNRLKLTKDEFYSDLGNIVGNLTSDEKSELNLKYKE